MYSNGPLWPTMGRWLERAWLPHCQTEVGELASGEPGIREVDENIGALEVEVRDSLGVHVRHPVGDLRRHILYSRYGDDKFNENREDEKSKTHT